MCKACDKVCEQKILEAVLDPLTGTAFSLVQCSSCGLGRTEPQPVDLAPYYPAAYYGGRHGATASFCVGRRLRLLNTLSRTLSQTLSIRESGTDGEKCANARIRECANETPRQGEADPRREEKCANVDGGRLLDIGCGDGSFLLAAKAQGWVVAGVERFPDDARQKGLEIFCDVGELMPTSDCVNEKTYVANTLDNTEKYGRIYETADNGGRPIRPSVLEREAKGGLFDCITLWHSLEHIADPFALLKEAGALLKPGGRVIVAVPDNGGWQARLFGRFWLHLDVPRHLWHFTLPALREAFQRAGLEVTQTHHQEFEYDLLGWSQSALNALFKTPNIFFNWLTKKPTGVGTPMLVVQVALGVIFSGLSVPLVWLGSLFRRGGTLVVVGHRKSYEVETLSQKPL